MGGLLWAASRGRSQKRLSALERPVVAVVFASEGVKPAAVVIAVDIGTAQSALTNKARPAMEDAGIVEDCSQKQLMSSLLSKLETSCLDNALRASPISICFQYSASLLRNSFSHSRNAS